MNTQSSLPLYLSRELRQIEQAARELPLMERAGQAAAKLAAKLALPGRPLLVLAGPGNNGGDACEAARHLVGQGQDVRLVLHGPEANLPAQAAAALARCKEAGLRPLGTIPQGQHWGLIVDGLFGIGLGRAVEGDPARLIESANTLAEQHACPLLALDCPSGLDSDRGVVRGTVIRASHTLTFIAAKPGLLTLDGPDQVGRLEVDSLELNPEAITAASGRSIARDLFAHRLHPRQANSHKGSYGSVGILGGAESMVGAAILAGRAALKLGAGRVYLGLLSPSRPAFDPAQPELMLRSPEALFAAPLTALACGPGLSMAPAAQPWVEKAVATDLPLVLDADALNLLAEDEPLAAACAARQAPTLITPHPAEAARLESCGVAEIQQDRIGAARSLAARLNAWVALKGVGTVVAAPDGRWWINTSGNAGMASAGQGDVLTGLTVALLAQGWEAEAALLAAVYLHGKAGDALVRRNIGPAGLTAGETGDEARRVFNRWLSGPR